MHRSLATSLSLLVCLSCGSGVPAGGPDDAGGGGAGGAGGVASGQGGTSAGAGGMAAAAVAARPQAPVATPTAAVAARPQAPVATPAAAVAARPQAPAARGGRGGATAGTGGTATAAVAAPPRAPVAPAAAATAAVAAPPRAPAARRQRQRRPWRRHRGHRRRRAERQRAHLRRLDRLRRDPGRRCVLRTDHRRALRRGVDAPRLARDAERARAPATSTGWARASSGQHEWVARMYQQGNSEDRANRISFYSFNLTGGLGAGSYFQDTVIVGQWIHYVGDVRRHAHVHLQERRACATRTCCPTIRIVPMNGTAPVRIGTRDMNSFFQGSIARVAIYNVAADRAADRWRPPRRQGRRQLRPVVLAEPSLVAFYRLDESVRHRRHRRQGRPQRQLPRRRPACSGRLGAALADIMNIPRSWPDPGRRGSYCRGSPHAPDRCSRLCRSWPGWAVRTASLSTRARARRRGRVHGRAGHDRRRGHERARRHHRRRGRQRARRQHDRRAGTPPAPRARADVAAPRARPAMTGAAGAERARRHHGRRGRRGRGGRGGAAGAAGASGRGGAARAGAGTAGASGRGGTTGAAGAQAPPALRDAAARTGTAGTSGPAGTAGTTGTAGARGRAARGTPATPTARAAAASPHGAAGQRRQPDDRRRHRHRRELHVRARCRRR